MLIRTISMLLKSGNALLSLYRKEKRETKLTLDHQVLKSLMCYHIQGHLKPDKNVKNTFFKYLRP